MEILRWYDGSLGKKVIVDKSSVPNTPEVVGKNIKAILGVESLIVHEKYRSLPSYVGRSKKQIFACIRDRVSCKVQGWNECLLSKGGREVLIKAVTQAIPSFVMSSFWPPALVCDDISSQLAWFW